jgi:hypothetical protein
MVHQKIAFVSQHCWYALIHGQARIHARRPSARDLSPKYHHVTPCCPCTYHVLYMPADKACDALGGVGSAPNLW